MRKRGTEPDRPDESRAFVERVHRDHHRFVIGVARRYVGDAAAEDVTSRVYEKLLHGRLPDPDRPLLPWLRRVVRNQAIDHLRVLRVHDPLDDAATVQASGHDLAELVAERLIVREALDRLSAAERDAVMAELVGFTTAEVAAAHGRTTHAMHSLATRARKQLRALLEPALLPAALTLAWLRRVFHRTTQPGMSYALDVAVVLAVVCGVGTITARPYASRPPAATSANIGAPEKHAPQQAKADSVPNGSTPSDHEHADDDPPPRPRGGRVDIEQEPGGATPKRIRIEQPRFDTPLGETRGETTYECEPVNSPPRVASIWRWC